MITTNVRASQLNYHRYKGNKYNREIVDSIPYHRELHSSIATYIFKKYQSKKAYKVIDLGVGTGITAKLVQDILPNVKINAVDFSRPMIEVAKKTLGEVNNQFTFGDYSKIEFKDKHDIVISVIGLHHQNIKGKKKMFKIIYDLLVPGGVFIFGDLVTYKNKYQAAYNNALHYEHLVHKFKNKKTLTEWAHHHMFLNDLAPIESQIAWLKKVGFKIDKKALWLNTALLICKK